jgi:hypothetical protein
MQSAYVSLSTISLFFFHHKVKNFVVLVRDGLKEIKIEQNKRSYEF